VAAVVTHFVVDTDYSATVGAFPFFLFLFQELRDAVCLNVAKILDHTHCVFFSIAVIQCFQICTRKNRAIKTILNLFCCQPVALLFDKRTLAFPRATAAAKILSF